MTVQEGQEVVQKSVVAEQLTTQDENIDPAVLASQLERPRKKAASRCSRCGSFDHNSRTCSL